MLLCIPFSLYQIYGIVAQHIQLDEILLLLQTDTEASNLS